MRIVYALIGWSGMLLILAAYFLNSLEIITPRDISYPIMNLVGTVFLGFEYFRKKTYPGVFLEIVWGAIAITNLVTIFW